MSKKKVLMQRFNGTGYDPQYPETHVKNVTGINQTVANNVGVATTDGATVIGEMSEIDYFVSPQGTTTGTSTAYNLNIGSQYTSLDDMDGVVIRAKFHTTTGDNPTLNVNGLGAKPILAENGANIPFQIGEGVWATLIWSSTLNGWIVQGWGKKRVFHKEIITKTTNWTVPEGIEGGIVNVMLFGGGGGGGGYNTLTTNTDITYFGYGGGGGGGYCSLNKIVKLTAKQIIPITIGAGGTAPTGSWYSRSDGGNGGTTSFGTYVSAAGGEGGRAGRAGTSESHGGTGGSGGSGGGGGSAGYDGGNSPNDYGMPGGAGGNGAQFGGGGGGYKAKAGNGGTYGGGGGAGHKGTAGTGGQYGGNGGAPGKAGNAGTNTTSIADIDFKGEGKGGSRGSFAGGGGGGYGGNGGKASGSDYYCSGGGGGGYGGNGGSGDIYSGGGGGGGYGGVGGDTGGGGGGYGANNYGAGGDEDKAGKSGICILTYWAWE